MQTAVLDQKETYREVNGITGYVGSVLFGTATLMELPVAELVQDFGLNISVCNRSVEQAVLADAFDLLDECVYELKPRKLFLNFGETDLARHDFDMDAFLADYRRLIETIHSGCGCRIFVVSVLSGTVEAQALNAKLRGLCDETGAAFVDMSDVFACEKPKLRLFGQLIHHMREGKISFSDAMHFCEA